MINKIIKDWVGEEIFYQGTYLNKVGRINGWEEEAFLRGRENGYNQALQYLTSRIPQLTERIERETLDKVIEFINSGHPEPCNDNGWSIDLSDVEDFINTLKEGKEN